MVFCHPLAAPGRGLLTTMCDRGQSVTDWQLDEEKIGKRKQHEKGVRKIQAGEDGRGCREEENPDSVTDRKLIWFILV